MTEIAGLFQKVSEMTKRPTLFVHALFSLFIRRRKEILKASEGPEEKRARRLAKKEAKERKRKEKMGWDQEYMGYTNADNPFGDEHLLDTFVWSKKMEKEGIEHHDTDEIHNLQKKKMEENRVRHALQKLAHICNMHIFFSAVKIENFSRKVLIFLAHLSRRLTGELIG